MACDSLQLLGDIHYNVCPLDDRIERGSSPCSSQRIKFLIIITAKFTRPVIDSEEEEESLFPCTEGRSIRFRREFSSPLDALTRDAVAKMLSDVHVPSLQSIVGEILETGRVMVDDRPEHDPRYFLRMNVEIDAFVDELPVPSEDDDAMEIDGDDDGDDDDSLPNFNGDDDSIVRFVPASKKSIQGLQKVRMEISEKPATCPVCFEDVLVGSEVRRLPCFHCYHGECIVKWLQNSKFCPLCRFEMPSN